MATCTNGGTLAWAVRAVLLAMAVTVGSNFVRSVTSALSAAAGHGSIHVAQPTVSQPRTFSG